MSSNCNCHNIIESSSRIDPDCINVHKKRKKEIIMTNDSSPSPSNPNSPNKKYKLSITSEDSGSSPSCSTSPLPSPSSTADNKRPPPNLTEWLSMFQEWSNSERMIALDTLITSKICDIQQMRYLLSIIEPQLQRDFISLLPKELSLYVLSFLDPPDLLRAAQTCRYWRILCDDNLLWREKCREEGLLDDNEALSDLFARRISSSHSNKSRNRSKLVGLKENTVSSQTNNNDSTAIDDSSPTQNNQTTNANTTCQVEYKLAYLHHKNIEYNWRYGVLTYNGDGSMQTFTNPPSDNVSILESQQQSSCASRSSRDLKNSTNSSVLQNKKPRMLKQVLHLKGHDDHVITCLQFNPTSNIIVSGSDDNTLKVWSSESGRCLRTLSGHTGGVWSSQLSDDNIVISGSTDRTLRVWNAWDGTCRHTLYGHTSTVRCMALHGREVVSGSRDATLRVWNIETGQCVHVLVGHVAAVRCVQFNGQLCVSGAYDFLVKVWDVATETCLHTLEGHTNRVYSLQFDGRHIVSGSLDTSIRVWNVDTGKLKHTLIGHQSLTSGMQLRNNILVSGNADSTVRVWDINTGKCLQTLSGTHKHDSAVTCLQFNSKFVITSSDDGTVKLWDLKTGEFIRNLVKLPSGGSGGVVWRIRASNTKLVCAVGSRNGTEETKLLVLDFETRFSNTNKINIEAVRSISNMLYQSISSLLSNCDNLFESSSPTTSQQMFGPNELKSLPQTISSSSNSSPSDSIIPLSSFCNNCKNVYWDFEQQQQQQQSNQSQAIPSTSISSSSSATSALSSLQSTPSSSNLVLTSISLASSSSQSNTSTIASSSSTTMAKSNPVTTNIITSNENITNNDNDDSSSSDIAE